MAASHTSTLKFQEYCTSPIFTILAGKDEVPFTVHSKLLRDRSPVIRAIMEDEQVSETETTVMKWTKWKPQTVAAFVQWLYTGEYECIVPYVSEQLGTDNDWKDDKEDGQKNDQQVQEPGTRVYPMVNQEVPASPYVSDKEEEVVDFSRSVYHDAREERPEEATAVGDPESLGGKPLSSSSDTGTISGRNDTLQTAVTEAQSQLDTAKANNQEALRAALESLSLSLRTRLQTPTAGDASSSGLFGHLGDFAEVASRIMAELREQEIRVQDLRKTAQEIQGAAETAAIAARDARFNSLFEQHQTETREAIVNGSGGSERHVTESGLSIVEELKAPLKRVVFKTASEYSLRGTQLYALELALKTIGLETPTPNDPGQKKSIFCSDAIAQHIEVYALAHCTRASDLGNFALHAFHIMIKVLDFHINLEDTCALDTFVGVIDTTFGITASGPLRELVARLAAWRHRKLIAVPSYTDLVAAGGDFAVQLALNLGRNLGA